MGTEQYHHGIYDHCTLSVSVAELYHFGWTIMFGHCRVCSQVSVFKERCSIGPSTDPWRGVLNYKPLLFLIWGSKIPRTSKSEKCLSERRGDTVIREKADTRKNQSNDTLLRTMFWVKSDPMGNKIIHLLILSWLLQFLSNVLIISNVLESYPAVLRTDKFRSVHLTI